MSSSHNQATGIYRHWAPVKDKERPNFIFSSDIPYKISTCVAELHLYSGGFSSRRVDLAEYIEKFDITLELNALLLRNKNITPSSLVQNNCIYVAKSKGPNSNNRMGNSISSFPEVWQSILSVQKSNETFVVNFCLFLDQFSVDLANVSDIRLHFHANDTFAPLLSSDIALTDHLKSYIRQKLISELKSNSEISIHIADSSTILQDSPPNESISQFKSQYANSSRAALDFANASLDSCETSCIIEKQLVFYDEDEEDDFDTSGDEIKILHSDESGKCHSNEDEDSEFDLPRGIDHHHSTPRQMNISTSSLSTAIDNLGLDSVDVLEPETKPQLASPFSESISTRNTRSAILEPAELLPFNKDVHEQRASVLEPSISPKVQTSLTESDTDRDDSTKQSNPTFEEFCRDIPLNTTECEDTISSPIPSPRKNDYSYTQQSSGEAPSIKKKPSLSFIDHDDRHGLKYAFSDSSSSVPEYIKENKKFKFIKVGKVQKFVNMFEEHKETTSNSSSRVGTRPSSPALKSNN